MLKHSMSGLVDKFMGFLHLYIENQPGDAIPFIRKQGSKNNLLSDYHTTLPNLHSLTQLCSIIDFTDDMATPHEHEGLVEGKKFQLNRDPRNDQNIRNMIQLY